MATASSEPPVAAGGGNLPWPHGLDVRRSEPFVSHLAGIQEIFHGYGVL